MKIYSLFYIGDTPERVVNSKIKEEGRLRMYLLNARALSISLQRFGFSLIILTNNKKGLEYFFSLDEFIAPLEIIEIDFSFPVPKGIEFYSAHFKIDVYKYFSGLDCYSVLLDLDVICLGRNILDIMNSGGRPYVYDISEQVVCVYGQTKILFDMASIGGGGEFEGRWCGGEMIAGDSMFFSHLYNTCIDISHNYFKCYKNLHHNGDEMIVSTAIELMRNKGFVIGDAGTLRGISRIWSGSVRHEKRRVSDLLISDFVHFPADKKFLAWVGGWARFDVDKFLRLYRLYYGYKYFRTAIVSIFS